MISFLMPSILSCSFFLLSYNAPKSMKIKCQLLYLRKQKSHLVSQISFDKTLNPIIVIWHAAQYSSGLLLPSPRSYNRYLSYCFLLTVTSESYTHPSKSHSYPFLINFHKHNNILFSFLASSTQSLFQIPIPNSNSLENETLDSETVQ